MSVSRRVLLAAASLLAWRTHSAHAQSGETVDYTYDVQGRITRAEYSNGVVVNYAYDNAGNRITVSRTGGATPPPPPVFSTTINLSTATGPVNLRTLANTAGYDGLRNATITFVVGSAVTITGVAGRAGIYPVDGSAIDTGLWPSASYTIALTLQVSGKVYGGGGAGGAGASDFNQPAQAGNAGGDAVYVQENLTVVVNSGGQIRSGGGGGGGGGGWIRNPSGEPIFYNGGDGGGGFPNGPGANNGTTGGGGAGSAGQPAMPSTRLTGAGGAGGGAGVAGSAGVPASGSGGPGEWVDNGSNFGGAAGYAIRKNGKTVGVTNNGTITGTVG
ncbi:MAG: RHS repeat protein [Hyphomicrobium sp.]|nr:RHS repeat protein [Hyphomicrobium sp.]